MAIKLELTRTFKASQEKVFQAFTEVEVIKRWFAPGNMTVPRADMEKREGGKYFIEMHDPGGDNHTVSGIIKVFKPNEKISYTWKWASPDAVETLVTITFREIGDETEVNLVHENFASQEACDLHQQGWEGCFSNFNKAYNE